ncbi:MAG: serine/threonine protein kinase [Gemmataceae bacterium]|nr:serine/threonine protein kinase [Gemmataceae bacterium]
MTNEARLHTLLLAWQEQREQGRDVPAAELCQDCPELAAELDRQISVLRRIHGMLRSGSGPGGPNGGDVPPDGEAAERPSGESSRPPDHTLDHPSAALSPPTSVPGYEILHELGRGGMGVVYKARQVGLNRLVALKMILAGDHAGTEAARRFLREAETIARLQHPNVVQVYDFGTHEGRPFFSLEYVEGGSLADRLNGTPQPAGPAARLVESLARTMQVAHEQGIIHRDLKPANVLLARGDPIHGILLGGGSAEAGHYEPKVTDFGLAKRADSGVTATWAVLGTPSYMASEQAGGQSKEVGPAADVYALGAILYELLTGRPPFKGTSTWDTIQMVVGADPVPPSRLQPQLPRDLDTICLKCLHKEPARRYASAGELAEDLRRFSGGRADPGPAGGGAGAWLALVPAQPGGGGAAHAGGDLPAGR